MACIKAFGKTAVSVLDGYAISAGFALASCRVEDALRTNVVPQICTID